MTRETGEHQFKQKLQQQLGIKPESIRFHWRGYYNQRFTPEGAIAYLKQTHQLYPELGILPLEQTAPVLAKLAPSPEVRI
jgi:hypothetical protein